MYEECETNRLISLMHSLYTLMAAAKESLCNNNRSNLASSNSNTNGFRKQHVSVIT